MTAQLFMDDDDGYLAWKADNPQGFILNIERSLRSASLTLHEATCRTLETLPPGYENWTHHYAKVCGDSPSDLEHWIANNVLGGVPRACLHCIG